MNHHSGRSWPAAPTTGLLHPDQWRQHRFTTDAYASFDSAEMPPGCIHSTVNWGHWSYPTRIKHCKMISKSQEVRQRAQCWLSPPAKACLFQAIVRFVSQPVAAEVVVRMTRDRPRLIEGCAQTRMDHARNVTPQSANFHIRADAC